MQTTDKSAALKRESAEPIKFSKRVGSTTYVVACHFSHSSKETLQDKILRLIESEVRSSA